MEGVCACELMKERKGGGRRVSRGRDADEREAQLST